MRVGISKLYVFALKRNKYKLSSKWKAWYKVTTLYIPDSTAVETP